ncbi:MAG: transposase, partial [Anaerolineales bacterium]
MAPSTGGAEFRLVKRGCLNTWRNQMSSTVVYEYQDTLYEKGRFDEQIRDAAMLIASGVSLDRKRQELGLSVSLGEQEVHWRAFLQSLVKRGLRGVQLIISDAHTGLQAARQSIFGGIPWQLHPGAK